MLFEENDAEGQYETLAYKGEIGVVIVAYKTETEFPYILSIRQRASMECTVAYVKVEAHATGGVVKVYLCNKDDYFEISLSLTA